MFQSQSFQISSQIIWGLKKDSWDVCRQMYDGTTLHDYLQRLTSWSCRLCDAKGENPFSSAKQLRHHLRSTHGRDLCTICTKVWPQREQCTVAIKNDLCSWNCVFTFSLDMYFKWSKEFLLCCSTDDSLLPLSYRQGASFHLNMTHSQMPTKNGFDQRIEVGFNGFHRIRMTVPRRGWLGNIVCLLCILYWCCLNLSLVGHLESSS